MDFHAFMYVTIGRRHELERGHGRQGSRAVPAHARRDRASTRGSATRPGGRASAFPSTICRSRGSSSGRIRG